MAPSSPEVKSASFDLAAFNPKDGITQNDAKKILEALKTDSGKKAWDKLDKQFIDNSRVDSMAEKIQQILGIYPADGKLTRATIIALEAFVKTGKIGGSSGNVDARNGNIEGVKKFEATNINQMQAAKLLTEFQADENSKPTKKAKDAWRLYSFDQRIALQKSIGTQPDGKLGILTISALQAKAKGEPYIGDAEMSKIVIAQLKAEAEKPADAPVKPADAPVKPADAPVKPADTLSSLNEKYDKGLNEVVETFNPSKYTYIHFSYDVASEGGKKSEKITEVVRIDNRAFQTTGINKDDLKGQNAYKLMHIIRLGSQSMPDWFQNIDNIASNSIPTWLTGEKRIDYINTILTRKGKDPIRLNILTEANKYLGSISKTATLGFWTAGKEGVKGDSRKADMQALQEEFSRTSKQLIESNGSENLSKYYTKLVASADNIQELNNLAKNDPILRDILKELELDVSAIKTGSFGSFTDGSKLKAIQKEITSGRREEFASIVDTKIKAQGTEAFIFREGQFQFSDTALQAATKSNGSGILKGNTLNEKGELTDIYLTANKLEKTKNIPGITSDIINGSKGKVVPIKDFEGLDNAQLYVSQSGELYLINSPKHIGALSQMLTTAGDRLSGDTAEKVYIAVGASLLTLAATDNLGGLNLGTPRVPRISGHGIHIDKPEINANLNNAVTGYAGTALFLNVDIAKLEAQTRKYGQTIPANEDLYKMAQAHGGNATEQLKQAVLASSGIPTIEAK